MVREKLSGCSPGPGILPGKALLIDFNGWSVDQVAEIWIDGRSGEGNEMPDMVGEGNRCGYGGMRAARLAGPGLRTPGPPGMRGRARPPRTWQMKPDCVVAVSGNSWMRSFMRPWIEGSILYA